EPLVELETEKVTLEVNAPSAGVLSEIVADSGATVAIGALLGALSTGAAAAKPAAKAEAPAAKAEAPAAKAEAPVSTPEAAMPPAPSAAKLAAENGVDLAAVAGSGKRGQVLKGDVIEALAKPAPAAPAPAPVGLRAPSAPDDAAREERVRLTRMRQTIARRLKDVQNTAAMLTTFNEVDMTEVIHMRTKYKEAFEKK